MSKGQFNHMTDKASSRLSPHTRTLANSLVSIVGLGLMGGSLAWALRERRACREVVGVARREETVALALERGVVDRATCDLAEGVQEADIVVLATPVRTILRLLGEIGPLLPEGCLVMDVGSTKREIVAAMERLPPHIRPLGGHPMCGKEKAGLEAAEPGLYEGKAFVLTPLERTPPEAVELGRELVEAVGARPVLMDAERHDYIVAAVSHLPYLLACGLMAAVDDLAQSDDACWQLAASGFRDTSRLAASDVTMMLDILLTNRKPVLEALAAFERRLQELVSLLEKGDEGGLRVFMEVVAQKRESL